MNTLLRVLAVLGLDGRLLDSLPEQAVAVVACGIGNHDNMGGLFRNELVEWATSMTYQAASGGGARHMREVIQQFGDIHASVADPLADPASAILEIDRAVLAKQRGGELVAFPELVGVSR